MTTSVWAAPILPGMSEAWRRFCQEIMASRRPEYAASRQRLGIVCEEAWQAPTPQGEMAVVYLQAIAPNQVWWQIHASQRPFDRWYRQQLQRIHGPALVQSLAQKQAERLYSWLAPSWNIKR